MLERTARRCRVSFGCIRRFLGCLVFFLCLAGLFDFLSGRIRRAPAWMQAAGLEWLHRVALEPRRLFYRYLTTNPHALYVLLGWSTATGGDKHLHSKHLHNA